VASGWWMRLTGGGIGLTYFLGNPPVSWSRLFQLRFRRKWSWLFGPPAGGVCYSHSLFNAA